MRRKKKMSKNIESFVLKNLVVMLREQKNDEQSVKHIRENEEFWLDIIGVAFIDAIIFEEENIIDHKNALRVNDE